MDDFGKYKIILYLLGALLYFLFTRKSKPKPVSQEPAPEQKPVKTTPQPRSTPKTLTSRTIKPADKTPRPAPVSLDDLLGQLGKQEKRKEQDATTRSSESLENEKVPVEDYEEDYLDKKKKGIRESSFIKDDGGKSFEVYGEQKEVNKYAEMFRDPESLKKLIIAQEIFTPKHF